MQMVILSTATAMQEELLNEASVYATEYAIIYLFCLVGAFIKDAIVAHKYKAKMDFVDLALYPILCAFVVSAAYDIINIWYDISMSVIATIAMLAGVWSRELVALLMNNRFVLTIAKIATKRATKILGKDFSDKEQDQLYKALQKGIQDAIKEGAEEVPAIEENNPEDELSTIKVDDPVGEFEWIEIIEK